jgi:uncharacterized phage protein (TIGR01671 family)
MRKGMGVYRGKRLDNGEWVEGSLLKDGKGRYYIGTMLFSKEYCATYGKSNGKTASRYLGMGFCLVDPATVGECTGLPDKNGKLIFEGDIINYLDGYVSCEGDGIEQPNTGEVCFETEVLTWYVTNRISVELEDLWTNLDYLEVAGNMHDNPELLNDAPKNA